MVALLEQAISPQIPTHAAFVAVASKLGLHKSGLRGTCGLSATRTGADAADVSRRRRGDLFRMSPSEERNALQKGGQSAGDRQHHGHFSEAGIRACSATAGMGRMVSRRYAIILALLASSPLFIPPTLEAAGNEGQAAHEDGGANKFGITDDVARSLVYERVLGSGSYKTVYLVSSSLGGEGESKEGGRRRYALAVERLRDKGNAREAFNGIEVAEDLAKRVDASTGGLFERVDGWWMQPGGVQEFAEGAPVFESLDGRTRKLPGRFLGSKYLVALKPVYDMDLKTFANVAPLPAPVGGPWQDGTAAATTGNVVMDEASAVKLALELCTAGRVLHESGIVHRDIKPKNCMLSGGSALIIDFGFAERAVEGGAAGGRVCASGQVRGELRYVLAKDVVRLRGCRDGDCFAMGKTIYEVVFGVPGSGESSGKQAIDAGSARGMNDRFRSILESASAGDTSRFRLGRAAAEHILDVCRGLCRESNPMSFADAEEALLLASGVADAGHGGISDDGAESWRVV